MKEASRGGNLAQWQSERSTKPQRAELSNLLGEQVMEHDAVAFLLGNYVGGDEFNGIKVYCSPIVRVL